MKLSREVGVAEREDGTSLSITVLVVDDSAFMRQMIKEMLEAEPDIDVVGVATNGLDALKKVQL